MAGHVLVVGAGLAGVSTCAALRAGGHSGPVTLIGAEPGPPYDRPPLSKAFLAAEADQDAIALQPPSWYADQGVRLLTGTPVTAIDAESGRADLADGSRVAADIVVLATGGTPRRPPGFPYRHAAVHLLRTRDDAARLRAALRPGTRLLVVGAGLIGAEVTATATKIGCAVTLVDPNPLPLAAVVGPHAAEALRLQHVRHGVRIGGDAGMSGHHLELVQYVTPPGTRGDRNISNPGAAHLAFAVRDIAAEYRRLLARGIRFFSEPNEITEGVNQGGAAVYFHGPDDIVHELVQPPPRLLVGDA